MVKMVVIVMMGDGDNDGEDEREGQREGGGVRSGKFFVKNSFLTSLSPGRIILLSFLPISASSSHWAWQGLRRPFPAPEKLHKWWPILSEIHLPKIAFHPFCSSSILFIT